MHKIFSLVVWVSDCGVGGWWGCWLSWAMRTHGVPTTPRARYLSMAAQPLPLLNYND